MNSHEIEKIKQVDQIMFNLAESKDFKANLTKAVRLLRQTKLAKNPATEQDLINTYTEQDLINTYIKDIHKRIPLNVIVHFNMDVLEYYANSSDNLKENLARECQTNFKKYALIVLHFDDQIATWQNEKSGADYRDAVQHLDQTRTNIHNICLNDIKILNRMAENDGLPAFADTKDRKLTRIDIGVKP
ncbi:DUF3232 domain-containing protein [Lactobacillus helveticus]|uniref:DUF3232 domain-containing protein n=1 Tax=Lactobacillus helveticus TaxID=1587 RepID=UPI0003E96A12|nr:DUF3232 domain-containing protein [Lactobacillus helveticus]AHI11690.1 hypothetical protein LBH_0678 [Lactobacillus helveticus H9]NRO07927.1 hypothetical protein [Lactobacillus helveticus]NRO20093.1 hypothetical protein [Lactobacillus helveticus]NRO46338.1 hypothetical protein [Lactobacillus helveticus]NRO59941.1 hypothetical protein [Lactobacillus helveticus]